VIKVGLKSSKGQPRDRSFLILLLPTEHLGHLTMFKMQDLRGHSDTRMTQKYAKLDPRRFADEAAQIFDNLSTDKVA
jgi:hypothetical protein